MYVCMEYSTYSVKAVCTTVSKLQVHVGFWKTCYMLKNDVSQYDYLI